MVQDLRSPPPNTPLQPTLVYPLLGAASHTGPSRGSGMGLVLFYSVTEPPQCWLGGVWVGLAVPRPTHRPDHLTSNEVQVAPCEPRSSLAAGPTSCPGAANDSQRLQGETPSPLLAGPCGQPSSRQVGSRAPASGRGPLLCISLVYPPGSCRLDPAWGLGESS